MARTFDSRQLSFDFEAPEPAVIVADPVQACRDAGIFDELAGYCTMYGSVQVRDAPYIPRSFAFPCDLKRSERLGRWQILLSTPAMGAHPIVCRIAAVTGITPEWCDGPGSYGQWHHAVDLATEAGIDRLLASQEHTTRDLTLRGICFGISIGRLTVASARRALAALGAEEPLDRSAAMLAGDGMSACRVVRVPSIGWPSEKYTREQAAWGYVHAIEDGWVTKPMKSRPMYVTPEGWRRKGEEPPTQAKKAA